MEMCFVDCFWRKVECLSGRPAVEQSILILYVLSLLLLFYDHTVVLEYLLVKCIYW